MDQTTLGEIAEPSRERALPTEVPAMPYVGLGHIEPHTMKLVGHSSTREIRSTSMKFTDGEYFVWDRDLKGFGVRVQHTGEKSYVVK